MSRQYDAQASCRHIYQTNNYAKHPLGDSATVSTVCVDCGKVLHEAQVGIDEVPHVTDKAE